MRKKQQKDGEEKVKSVVVGGSWDDLFKVNKTYYMGGVVVDSWSDCNVDSP